jgi:N-succinyl-L-ornithine transcarbamylase
MKHFLKISDLKNLKDSIAEAKQLKQDPMAFQELGQGKTICLLFFNNSLRTRLSTQKAARLLGLEVLVMNFGTEGWQLELEDGVVMNAAKSEHIKEAARVVSQYCDMVGIRAFASLKDKEKDLAEEVLSGFQKYAGIPVLNLESSTRHPLQALADAITMDEYLKKDRPKVVLTWAPHPKALPHAVANSFIAMMQLQDHMDFVITHPKGYELDPDVVKSSHIEYDQNKAFRDADFIYAKNWSSFVSYGEVLNTDPAWMVTKEKMGLSNQAKFMHCLPVRRNVVVEDAVIDSEDSLVIEQANNRTYAAQLVLKKLLLAL